MKIYSLHYRQRSRPGAMLLITVMIVGVVALLVSVTLALSGIAELDMSFAGSMSHRTQALADACMEEALVRLWGDASYEGGEISLNGGTCKTSISGPPKDRIVRIDARVRQWVRSVEARVDAKSPEMKVLQWGMSTYAR